MRVISIRSMTHVLDYSSTINTSNLDTIKTSAGPVLTINTILIPIV